MQLILTLSIQIHVWNIGRLKICRDSAFQELQFTMRWNYWALKAALAAIHWDFMKEMVISPVFVKGIPPVLAVVFWTKQRMLKSCQHSLFSNGTSFSCQMHCHTLIRCATTWAKQRSSFLSCVTSLRLLNTSVACGCPYYRKPCHHGATLTWRDSMVTPTDTHLKNSDL